jgi:GTPase SAR1 family protein
MSSIFGLFRPRKSYSLTVLGARSAGKSTLIHSWRGLWEEVVTSTQVPHDYTKVKLTSDGMRLKFDVITDMGGFAGARGEWKGDVKKKRYVLYLADARILSGELNSKELNMHRLEDDTGLIGKWLKESEDRRKRCVLVVTHKDECQLLGQMGEYAYSTHIRERLEPLVDKLGRTESGGGCNRHPKR